MVRASTRKHDNAEKRSGPWLVATRWLLVAAAALVPLASGYVPFVSRPGIINAAATPAQSATLGLLVGGMLLCWTVALVRGEARLKRVPYGWLLGGFLVLVLASGATAIDRTVAVFGNAYAEQGLLTIAAYATVFLLATQIVETPRQLTRVIEAMALSGSLVALLAVMQVLGWLSLPDARASFLAERGTATLGNPDMLGTFLIVPLLISVGLSVTTVSRWKWLWTGCVAVTAASLLLTQTRGAWLGALIALAIFAVVLYRSTRQGAKAYSWWAAAGVLVLVGLGVAIYKAATGSSSLFRRLALTGESASGGRLLVWSEVLKVIGRHPILGAGPDNILYGWYQVSTSAQVHTMGIDGVIDDAHNYWLGTAASSGVLAAILLVVFVVSVVVGSRSAVTKRLALPGEPDRVAFAALWAGVVGLAVALVFSPVLTPIGLVLWLSLGLLALPNVRPLEAVASSAWARYAALGVSALVGVALVGWGAATGLSSTIEVARDSSATARLSAAQSASRIAPWRQSPLYLQSEILKESGAPAAEIVPVFDKLIALSPHEYYYYATKARLLGGQPKLVIATADEGLAAYPAGLRLIAQRALAQAQLGDFATAERDAAGAWAIARDVVPALREPFVGGTYAQILAAEGKTAQAKAVLAELAAAFPGNPDVQKLQSLIMSGGK